MRNIRGTKRIKVKMAFPQGAWLSSLESWAQSQGAEIISARTFRSDWEEIAARGGKVVVEVVFEVSDAHELAHTSLKGTQAHSRYPWLASALSSPRR